jgi:hypothetical protein
MASTTPSFPRVLNFFFGGVRYDVPRPRDDVVGAGHKARRDAARICRDSVTRRFEQSNHFYSVEWRGGTVVASERSMDG